MFQSATFLGKIAGPVGGDGVRQSRVHFGQKAARSQRGQLGTAPRADESQRARAFDDQFGENPGGLDPSRTAYGRAVLASQFIQQRWLPQRDRARPRGDASSVIAEHSTPVSRVAKEAGEAVVAEASTNTGEAP